jgi:hypothetical protein
VTHRSGADENGIRVLAGHTGDEAQRIVCCRPDKKVHQSDGRMLKFLATHRLAKMMI